MTVVDDSADMRALVAGGGLLGTVYPAGTGAIMPDQGAREYALDRLRQFIAAIVFRRTMAEGQAPQRFRIPDNQIHLFQPDDGTDADLPSVAFLPGETSHDVYGLGPAELVEESADVFEVGKVLVLLADYVERVTIEVWAAKHAARRAVKSGIETAMLMSDSSSVLRLALPAYFNQVATYTLIDGPGYYEEVDAIRNRRKAQIPIELRVPELVLVDYRRLQVVIDMGGVDRANVFDGNVWLDLGITRFDPWRYLPHADP